MTTTLTARGPEDLLAAVPVVLGFHPRDSLVMLTFDAPHSFHARVGLPPPDEVHQSLPELVDALVTPCRSTAGRPRRVPQLQRRRPPLGHVAGALLAAFDGAGIDVIAVLRAHEGLWWLVPPDPGQGESAPTPYDETTHPFAAQAVLDGRVTHVSREALRATVAAEPEAAARVAALQAAKADRTRRRRLGGRPGAALRGDPRAAGRRRGRAASCAPSSGPRCATPPSMR